MIRLPQNVDKLQHAQDEEMRHFDEVLESLAKLIRADTRELYDEYCNERR